MKLINAFIFSFLSFLKGIHLLCSKPYRRFVWAPLLLNIIIFSLIFKWGFSMGFDYINSIGQELSLPGWLSWLGSTLHILAQSLRWLLILVFTGVISLILAFISSSLTHIVGAPLNGLLSEKVDKLEFKTKFEKVPLVTLIHRSLLRELIKIKYYLPRLLLVTLSAIVISSVPIINLLAPIMMLTFGAWMFSIQYFDYPADNRQISFKDFLEILRQNRTLSLSYGFIMTFTSSIPILNFFVIPAGIIGATLIWAKKLNTHPNIHP